MSHGVQDLSSSVPTVAAAPDSALPETSPAPGAANPVADQAEPETEGDESLLKYATGAAAIGYYLSMAMHLVAYAAAAIVFTWIGQVLNEDDVVTPIRASLDDFDRNAEQPKFEVVPEVTMGGADGESSIQRISSNLSEVENGLIDTLANDALPSLLNNNDNDDSSGAGAFLFSLPESGLAVTKGSFTVWTEPEKPQVRQPYYIIIEVRLKNDTKIYRVNDLSGYVVGSDKYRQKIPYDIDAPSASFFTDEDKKLQQISGAEKIKVRHNKVQLAIRVPGAGRLVKDIIQIRSRRLREKQDLELVFGQQ